MLHTLITMNLFVQCCSNVAFVNPFKNRFTPDRVRGFLLLITIAFCPFQLKAMPQNLCLLEDDIQSQSTHFLRIEDPENSDFFIEAQVKQGNLYIHLHLKNSSNDRSQTLYGSQQIPKIMEHFNSKKVPIHSFIAELRTPPTPDYKSDTLTSFNECMSELKVPNPEYCVKKNWIYRQARNIKFSTIKSIFVDDSRLIGETEYVRIEFTPDTLPENENPWDLFKDEY